MSHGDTVYITKRAEVATAHRCTRPGWDAKQNAAVYGIEARPHGHNYLVAATLSGPVDETTGMVVNIKDVKYAMGRVLEAFDHKNLNGDHPDFATSPPTSERIAETIRAALSETVPHGTVERIRLSEGDTARYTSHRPGSPLSSSPRRDTMHITRRYSFSAAHRLHAPHLSDAENRELFQDCNNPNGHGHTYALEVTVQGNVDGDTGLAVNHAHLDRTVREAVVDRYNYNNLNDIPEFAGRITTSENLVRTIWQVLEKHLGEGVLHRIKLGETRDNEFEYYG